MVRAALVGTLVALSLCASAVAAPFNSNLNLAYHLAEGWWNRPINCSSLDEVMVPSGSLTGPDTVPGDLTRGRATQGSGGPCVLYADEWLSRPQNFAWACAVMRHEYGHLIGLGHSTEPSNVMYPVISEPPYDCRMDQKILMEAIWELQAWHRAQRHCRHRETHRCELLLETRATRLLAAEERLARLRAS